MALERVGEVPALVSFVPLRVCLNITTSRSKNSLILLKSGEIASRRVCVASTGAWVAGLQI